MVNICTLPSINHSSSIFGAIGVECFEACCHTCHCHCPFLPTPTMNGGDLSLGTASTSAFNSSLQNHTKPQHIRLGLDLDHRDLDHGFYNPTAVRELEIYISPPIRLFSFSLSMVWITQCIHILVVMMTTFQVHYRYVDCRWLSVVTMNN